MTTLSVSESVLVDAAVAVAEAFGLGDSAAVGKSWLVDEGDTVIVAALTGGLTGELLLAVNDEVARRLTSDQGRLTAGLGKALAVLSTGLGIADPVEFGEVSSSPAMGVGEPIHRIEVRDGEKLCALLGVTVASSGDDAELRDETGDPGGSLTTTAFDPAPFGEQPVNGQASAMAVALGPLALLQDVDMEVTVELGRTTMPIRDLLALQPGMVVEIDRVAGAPIDVLVNGRRFACGEVVVIDEEFGLRITEIVGAS